MTERLSRREIHLWWAPVTAERRHLDTLIRLLDEDERHRAGRFLVAAARDRFVVGRGLLRITLGRYLNREPESLRFTYGPHGKPTLDGVENTPAFNASHAGDLAVVAVADAAEVGVDVERLRKVARAERLARRFFTPAEHELVKRAGPAAGSAAFLHIWTCKEALLKAIGTGIAAALDSVEVTPDPEEPPRLLTIPDGIGDVGDWSLLRCTPCAGHLATVAIRGQGWRLVVREAQWR